MRKALRIAASLTGGLAILSVSLALSSLTGVDRSPAPGTAWHTATVERLAALRIDLPADSPRLEAGFGRTRLTPRPGIPSAGPGRNAFTNLPLAGYGARQGRPATGTREELWAKAVALRSGPQRAILVAADALIIPRNVADIVAARVEDLGLTRADLYFGATHTHGSIGGWGEGPVGELFAGAHDPGAVDWFAQCLAEAVREAWNHLEPAGSAHAGFDAPEFVRNRLVGDAGRIDPRFDLLVVRQDDGDLAVLGSYAAHATVLGADVMEWHGDYPGAWQRAVEARLGGMALFFAGGVGSHSPRPPERGFEGAEAMGIGLADRTVAAIDGIHHESRPRLALASLRTDLPELQVRVTDALRLRPAIASRLLPVAEDTWVQALRLGDTLWFSTPCDFSGELTLELRERLKPLGLAVHVTSFNGDYLGYVIPSRYFPMDGYEPRTMSFHGPALSDYLMSLLEGLGQRVVRAAGP